VRGAAQRTRATSNLLRATGIREDPNHHDLAHRVASALAMTEAAGMEARRKLGQGIKASDKPCR
jgi:pyrroloquinoline quinone (PQQ) biosynthesis protein C